MGYDLVPQDARGFGPVHLVDIVGYVDYIYWPSETWSRFGVANDRLPKITPSSDDP